MASLSWWRNGTDPEANNSREGNTLLPSCSCLGWEILNWRGWGWKDRYNISRKQIFILIFFPLDFKRDLWAFLQSADSTSLWMERAPCSSWRGTNQTPPLYPPFSSPNLPKTCSSLHWKIPFPPSHSRCALTPISKLKAVKIFGKPSHFPLCPRAKPCILCLDQRLFETSLW